MQDLDSQRGEGAYFRGNTVHQFLITLNVSHEDMIEYLSTRSTQASLRISSFMQLMRKPGV